MNALIAQPGDRHRNLHFYLGLEVEGSVRHGVRCEHQGQLLI